MLVIGGVVLGIAINSLGWDGMKRVFETGWWFALIAAIDVASGCMDAFAIQGFLRPKQRVPYLTVFAAQMSGIAVNRLTPGNSIGEPVKVTMLTAQQVPTNLAVSAVVMFNLATMYVGTAALVIGVPITAIALDLPHQLAVFAWIVTAVLVGLAIAVAMVVRRGAVGTLIDALASARIVSPARAKKWRGQVADIDTRLRELGGDTKTSGLARGLVGVIGSRVLNWCGTVAVLHAAGIPLTPMLVVATLSLGIVVTWISNIIPLGLGIADGTNFVLYDLLGATAKAGLIFTMIGRVRTVVLAVIGLSIMAIAHAFQRDRSPDPHPPH